MERTGVVSVIVYGLGNTVRDAIGYIRTRFHVVGCSDSDVRKAAVGDELGILFVPPDELCGAKYDYIVIASVYDDEISRQLVEEKGVAKDKILRRAQWDKMLFWDSFGERNPNRTFYVLSHPIHLRDGLYSYLFAFLEQLDYVEKNDCIPVVDMQNFWCQYVEEGKSGKENVWEYYYQPLSEYPLSEVYESKNVILGYDDNCYKSDYENKYDIKRMSELYKKYIRYNPTIISMIEEEYRKKINKNKRTLGVLYRGTDMSALKLRNHPIQPSIDEMIRFVHQYMDEWDCDEIFLSTEDAHAAEKFQKEFGGLLDCTKQKRFGDTGDVWLADINFERENDKYQRGLEYIITIELLSRCDCLLAGICTGSICAQIMNDGRYEHIKMIDKGAY